MKSEYLYKQFESSTLVSTATHIDSFQVFPSGSNSVANQFVSIPVNGNVVRAGNPDAVRLEVCFNNLLNKGYSLDTANLFANSHKASTRSQYQSGWKLWLSYL